MFKKKSNPFFSKFKELTEVCLDYLKTEANLFVQELWENTTPLILPLVLIIVALFGLFVGVVLAAATFTLFLNFFINSYLISITITTLITFLSSIILFVFAYLKLKNHRFELKRTFKQFEKNN